jgi:hypothetical protein
MAQVKLTRTYTVKGGRRLWQTIFAGIGVLLEDDACGGEYLPRKNERKVLGQKNVLKHIRPTPAPMMLESVYGKLTVGSSHVVHRSLVFRD